jgi:hypothetical protein
MKKNVRLKKMEGVMAEAKDSMRKPASDRHWEGGDLLRKLYGLVPEGGASEEHLTLCGECSGRWAALLLTRQSALSEASADSVPETRLIAQRRALWERIDHPRRFLLAKWAPAVATALMLVVGVVLLHPPQPQPAQGSHAQSVGAPSISDAELFGDLSAMAAPAAPRAAEPIRGLFESSSSQEEESF